MVSIYIVRMSANSNAGFVEQLLSTTAPADGGSPIEEEVVALFGKLRHPLLRYVCAFGVSASDSEELVQEAFLALFEHLRRGKSRLSLHGWLFRVCHNLALKHRGRQRGTNGVPHTDLDWPDAAADESPNPEELFVETQRRHKLQSVLQALPEQDRCCVCLRAEGLRYRDIAEILGISLGAVSASLARSLARFERADHE